MSQLFEDFIESLREIDERLVKQLKKGADEKQIRYLDKVSDSMPDSYIEFLKCANGQKMDFGQIFGDYEFLSAYQVRVVWGKWKELIDEGEFEREIYQSKPAKEISSVWWSSDWIPIAGENDCICIDNSPSKHGTKGQIICAFHDEDERILLANSFEDYIKDLTNKYRSGEVRPYIYSEDDDEDDGHEEIWEQISDLVEKHQK